MPCQFTRLVEATLVTHAASEVRTRLAGPIRPIEWQAILDRRRHASAGSAGRRQSYCRARAICVRHHAHDRAEGRREFDSGADSRIIHRFRRSSRSSLRKPHSRRQQRGDQGVRSGCRIIRAPIHYSMASDTNP